MSRCLVNRTEPVFRTTSKSFERSHELSKEALVTTLDPTIVADRVTPRWQDPTLPAADRVDLLLEQMTLEEKVAQLGSRWIGGAAPDVGAGPRPGPGAAPHANP